MEWLRYSYKSKWRLDSKTDTLTAGRYYRASDTTPFYPGIHLYGSRIWTSNEREPNQMGEYDGSHSRDKGNPPPVLPLPQIVGNKFCIEQGGGGGNISSDPERLERFLPAACYASLTDNCELRILKCPDRAKFADIMQRVYTDDSATPARNLLGEGASATTYASAFDALTPSYTLARLGDECHIYIDGTRNQGQMIWQIYGAIDGPVNYGRYSANPLYDLAANIILRAAADFGSSDCRCFTIVGHSYGGATAAVAAAILRINRPDAKISLLTFGAPRAGGDKLIEVLRTVTQKHVRRPFDPVATIPPQYTTNTDIFGTIFNVVSAASWLQWGRYANYEGAIILFPDGSFADETTDVVPYDTQRAIALAINALTSPGGFDAHFMQNYRADMLKSCGIEIAYP